MILLNHYSFVASRDDLKSSTLTFSADHPRKNSNDVYCELMHRIYLMSVNYQFFSTFQALIVALFFFVMTSISGSS